MVSIGQRIVNGSIETLKNAPISALANALCGYVYAKFADLPAGQVAKAWAIWGVAQESLVTLADNFIENKTAKSFTIATIEVAGTYIGITELRKRDLMGDKMMIFLIAMRALSLLNTLVNLSANDQQQTVAAAG